MVGTWMHRNHFMLVFTSGHNTQTLFLCYVVSEHLNSHQFCPPLLAPPPSGHCHLVFSVDPHRQQSSRCHCECSAQLCRTCICDCPKTGHPSVSQHSPLFSNRRVYLNKWALGVMYLPMKKCVSPVRMAPTAIRKQPMAMSFGRCNLAPKWLTTARNSKLPKW